MRLFKIASVVASVALAGDKIEANDRERDCLQDCKNRENCHGQDLTAGPTECITLCRKECMATRKDKIISHLRAQGGSMKKQLRKAANVKRRAEHRANERALHPPPMIKDFHKLYDEGEIKNRKFFTCLKGKKAELGCLKGGTDSWECKREMVGQCLDIHADALVNLGSTRINQLVEQVRTTQAISEEAKMNQEEAAGGEMLLDSSSFGIEQEESEAVADDTLLGVEANKHGRFNVRDILKAQRRKLEGQTEEHVEGDDADLESAFANQPDLFNDNNYSEVEEGEEYQGLMVDDMVWVEDEQREVDEVEIAELTESSSNDGNPAEEEEEVEGLGARKKAHGKKTGGARKKSLFTFVGGNGHRHKKNKNGGRYKARARKISGDISKERFIDEMCKCRTSQEHRRVQCNLNKDNPDFECQVDTCKFCAFPNSKKCWACQKEMKELADKAQTPRDRTLYADIEMACFIMARSVKNGQFHAMNSQSNDPCPMQKVHYGSYNPWQKHRYGDDFSRFAEKHHHKEH